MEMTLNIEHVYFLFIFWIYVSSVSVEVDVTMCKKVIAISIDGRRMVYTNNV